VGKAEFGIEISAGQVNRLLLEEKAAFIPNSRKC